MSSFLSFAVGAGIPLLPFVFAARDHALVVAGLLTALALFAVGATLSLFTGRGALVSGARMLLLGGLAAAVTFGVGHLFGVSTG
jgi:VIT1/CCC1 family predicted Fe2+/Mn2+ transporter